MANSLLFTPFTVRNVELANRIVIAPMCQYSAVDGQMTDWHVIHLGSLALSGAGVLIIEATAVVPEGRITYADVGLWSDETEEAIGRTLESVRRWSRMPIAIQLAHAGRKASTEVPWKGGKQFPPDHRHGWQTVSASALPYDKGWYTPTALDAEGLARVRDAFADAARRAARLGIDAVQVHGAHGYLLHQFLSPLSNARDDAYGGSLENRMRFPLEVLDAVRSAFPADRSVTMRVSGTDWADGGWDIEQTIELARRLAGMGIDLIDCSSGGMVPHAPIPTTPGYQVPFAERIKHEAAIATGAVGLITTPQQANDIITQGKADLVVLARELLRDPYWPLRAARDLGHQVPWPAQYLRAAPPGTVAR